jgi:hypothetical protein
LNDRTTHDNIKKTGNGNANGSGRKCTESFTALFEMSLGDIAREHKRVCYLKGAEGGKLSDLRGSNREVQNTILTL